MAETSSILDKIIESQERQQAALFNPSDLVVDLLKNISTKEGDILSRRFGLLGKKKETLEQIGQYYQITRERIRQIETATVKKLKDLKTFRQQVEVAEQHIMHLLEKHGGVMEQGHLLDSIIEEKDKEGHLGSSNFILSKLLNDKVEAVKADTHLLPGWKLPVVPVEMIRKAAQELVNIIDSEQKLLNSDFLIEKFKNREFYQQEMKPVINLRLGYDEEKLENELEQIIHSYLRVSKNIDQNILGEWGLASWNTITPKRMSDKIYLILRKTGKPLHFTEITEQINQSSFYKKTAYPATIHNELILDDRYILVGRGIYALKEWGYKSGTVIDIITEILKNSSQPMTKEEIVDAVLKQRMVRKSTIYLALTNKSKIKRLSDGRYTIAE